MIVEVWSASNATGAPGRPVATRTVGVGPTLPGECQGFAPTPRPKEVPWKKATNRETEKKRPRPYRFAVRLSPEEHAHIVEQAKIVSRTPPDMLRALGLGQRLKAVPKWPEDVFRAIKSFGNNLNQLARQANMGHVDTKAVEALRDEIHDFLNFLRSRDKPVSKVKAQSNEAEECPRSIGQQAVSEETEKAGNLRSEAPY